MEKDNSDHHTQNKELSEEKPIIIPDSKPEIEENTNTEKLEIEQKQTKCSSYGTETKFHNPIHKKSASDVVNRSDLAKTDCLLCILC